MANNREEEIAGEVEKKYRVRDSKKRKRMHVGGKSVFTLKSIMTTTRKRKRAKKT